MALDSETKKHLMRLQDEALEILGDLSELLPPSYRLTLLARNCEGEEDTDIVLTNDVTDDAIAALERNKIKMENAE